MAAAALPSGAGWRYGALLVVALLAWLVAWYWETAETMVGTWSRSDTFAHGFVILPISAWLVWRSRASLAALEPSPRLGVLALLALAGFGWLVAEMASVNAAQQFAFVLMIPLLVWAVLGTAVARALAFPLGFLLFAVPFGDFLEPLLMEHTADFTVAALRLTGIPVYREGLFFMVPSGSWSIVEACSGLRYLIASVTLGVLYAYLTYRSVRRRLIFVAVSAVVPIVANWLRAYMIVMIGHLSGMKYAVGVDHLIYGWAFFGVVVMILFWIGSFWREDLAPPSPTPERAARVSGPPRLAAMAACAALAAGLAALWPEAAGRIEARMPGAPVALAPLPPHAGWAPVAAAPADWRPRFHAPRGELLQTFARGGERAGLYIAYYRKQGPATQLISARNVLVASDHPAWRRLGEQQRDLEVRPAALPLLETRLTSRQARLLVWRSYWVDGRYVASPTAAKLMQAKSRLFGNGDDSAVVIVYAPYDEGPQPAEQALRAFMEAMLPAITRQLEDARRT